MAKRNKKNLPTSNVAPTDAKTALQKLKAISNLVNGDSIFESIPTQSPIELNSAVVNDNSNNDSSITGAFVNHKEALDCLEFKIQEKTTREISNIQLSFSSKISSLELKFTEKFSQEKSSILFWVFGIIFSFSAVAFWNISNMKESIQNKIAGDTQTQLVVISNNLASATKTLIDEKVQVELGSISNQIKSLQAFQQSVVHPATATTSSISDKSP